MNGRHHFIEGFTRDVASHHATVAQARPAIQPAFSFYRCPELRGHSTIYAPSALKYRGNIADLKDALILQRHEQGDCFPSAHTSGALRNQFFPELSTSLCSPLFCKAMIALKILNKY